MHLWLLPPLLVGGAMAVYLLRSMDPALTISAGVVLTVFSGHWGDMGVPLPLDRLVLGAGMLMVVARLGPAQRRPVLRLGWRHLLLLALGLYAIASAFGARTLGEHDARFALLDQLSLAGFAVYALAPVAFDTARRRAVLAGALVLMGLYLGLEILFEAVHLDAAVWPKYILDPHVGITFGRGRGPFTESASEGQVLVCCGAAAAIALGIWRGRTARALAWLVLALCIAGIPLTYTRSVWIAAALGAAVPLLAFRDLRPRFVRGALLLAGALVLALAVVPGLSSRLSDRYHDQGTVDIRRNVNAAAADMIASKPVTGFGWATFRRSDADYLHLVGDNRLTGYGVDLHNVALLRTVELGILGAGLWALAFLTAWGRAAVRPQQGDLRLWHRTFLAVAVAWLAGSLLTPMAPALPNMLVWLWAGLLDAGPEPEPEPELLPAVAVPAAA